MFRIYVLEPCIPYLKLWKYIWYTMNNMKLRFYFSTNVKSSFTSEIKIIIFQIIRIFQTTFCILSAQNLNFYI